MTIVSHSRPFVIGVDCHARTHTYAILDPRTGQQIGCQQFPSTSSGMNRAISWVARHAGGDLGTLWVIEGIGAYGARLARAVTQAGYDAVEAPRMSARARRGIGKSDPLDAAAIAVAVLGLDETRLRQPRQDEGVRAALRTLASARDQLTRERTVNVNALTALVRVNDLGIDARKPLTTTQILTITRWREREEPLEVMIAREEAIRLARRINDITAQLDANQKRMTGLIQQSPAAPILDITGVGAVTAAVILTAWSHPDRVRNEAAFASLAGVSPIPASSGNTTRHRLNRGGDRRLNRALHTIAMVRMTHDPDTRAYVEKRIQEGRTTREIRRALKRYIARHLYRTLNTLHAAPMTI
ncbi:IS110 family transposase [Arthrobacter sp. H14]|uniref:IS110 family transposase n=1 Tax=Arthrobacter sp. H14 TaxID=1312959 RepID=UPI0004793404|nr:IS110 family transposase [Arthrobacter sp. H14]